jgi:saccharopine dehydrogenase (NAD+, L-lysine forming)
MLKVGIIRETKNPPDTRTPLIPEHIHILEQKYPVKFYVQTSPDRCFKDEEYAQADVAVVESLADCDIIMGIKEIDPSVLLKNKTYVIFSHTIKQQPYNKQLLKTMVANKNRLIDYELLTDESGTRVAAFGFFAGMVGAHNGVYALGKKNHKWDLPRMYQSKDYEAILHSYNVIKDHPIKIVVTGTGRVASGAVKVLIDMGVKEIGKDDFLTNSFNHAVFTQLGVLDYYGWNEKETLTRDKIDKVSSLLHSTFMPYTQVADLLIHGIFWNENYPAFFTVKDMQSPTFKLKVIADIACDIAPFASIPCTIRPSTIENPVYGYNPQTGEETSPFQSEFIDVMAIDNLPNELPRDASKAFSQQLVNYVMPGLIMGQENSIIERAIITERGQLTPKYTYLKDYIKE